MASWTDKNQLPFNPYVQQVPVEAYVSVGLEKQQRYDQGIQKIQASIDNVAGLDVVRDVDKTYLQSKLSQLNNNLKTVAAGDFSNFQLVNSVSGMATQIAKDPNVINAATSTKYYRKGLEDMATFTKEGKGSPSNDWDFKTQAGNWLNSKDIRSTFTGSYTPYTDYKKNALELIKALTKDETITDDAFTIDKNGNPVITDVLVRRKFAGVTPEKIQQALLSGLSPADYKQMEIDGRYNYSNMDAQTFSATVNNSYKEKFETYAEKRTALANSIDSTTDIAERDKIKTQVASIDKELKSVSEEYKGIASTFANGDAESAKARLNTMNFLKGFSKAFSFTQTSQTVESSPYAQIQMQREIKNQDWKKFTLQYEQADRHFNANLEFQREKLSATQKKNALKEKGLGGYGGLPGTVSEEDVLKYGRKSVEESTKSAQESLVQDDANFMKQHGKDQAWLDQQEIAYLKSPSGADPMIAQHFKKTVERRRLIESNQVMLTQIDEEAKRKFGDVYSSIPDLNTTLNDGSKINYTARELVDFNDKANKYTGYLRLAANTVIRIAQGIVPLPVVQDKVLEDFKKTLSQKELLLFDAVSRRRTGRVTSKAEDDMVAAINNVEKINTEVFSKVDEFVNSEVARRTTSSQGAYYGFPIANPEQRTQIGNLISRFAIKAEKQNGKLENSPNWDTEKARDIVADPNSQYSIEVVEGTEIAPAMYEITANDSKKNVIQFKVTPEDKRATLGREFEPSKAVQAIRPYQEQIRKMGGYSTAKSPGTTTIENSYLRNIDFPQVRVYGITGNIETPDNGVTYSVRVNIHDPMTGKDHENIAVPISGLVTEERLAEVMMTLTDAVIYERINKKPMTAEDYKKLVEFSKKPL